MGFSDEDKTLKIDQRSRELKGYKAMELMNEFLDN